METPYPPSTPFPSVLIDQVMPALTDTEWRVLCVVVRQTLGWRDPATGGRKARDWLSHRQLKARTGRASEAVSRAIDGLVRRGLLRVSDAADRPLATPRERRRHAGRLYFRLSSPQEAGDNLDKGGETCEGSFSESGIGKPKTTKETETKSNLVEGTRIGDNSWPCTERGSAR